MTSLTIGTHNLHDASGRPTPFADVVLFTEVDPSAQTRIGRLWLWGYDTVHCRRQPSLAISFKRRMFDPVDGEYRLAHKGLAGVTPDRGTYVVLGSLRVGRDDYRPTALLVEHRINAAFPPYVRGEEAFRRRCWETHTALTLGWIAELESKGYLVIAGGDLNTPRDVVGYRAALHEQGRGYDRLGATARGTHLNAPTYLSRMGSDHPRLRATLDLR